MSIETSPIRLIMFTSASCVYCPPIELIVHEVVGSGMQDLVHVSTIDIDIDKESAKEYNINVLPTLVINDEVVLEGGMDDDSVRDLLWSTLMNYAFTSVETEELVKASLLTVTMNSIDSLNNTSLLRPSIGDYAHIGTYQQSLLSLYSLDPLIPHFLYRAGHKLGKYGIMHHILLTLNLNLGKTPKRKMRYQEFGRALELYFSNREIYSTLIAESALVVSHSDSSIHLKVTEMASASIGMDVGEPMCGFTAGQLAGVTEAVMGTRASCEEQICLANGGDFCLFKISIDQDFVKQTLPPVENKDERTERRLNFYEIMHEIRLIGEDSLLMRKKQRPNVGDFIHISVFQPIIISLKLLDRLSGVVLYSAGRELGVFGPGKNLLYRLVYDNENYANIDLGENRGVVSPDEGVMLLDQYLNHPTTHLSRDYAAVRTKKIDDETYHIEIEENSYVAGMNKSNLGKTFCDFQAGFFAGRLHILINIDPTVQEIKCQGKGDEFCVFEIKVSSKMSMTNQ